MTTPAPTCQGADGTAFWPSTVVSAPVAGSVGELPDSCDVLVVGAGYTGLWSALALLDADPTLTVCVVDAAAVGDGASGINGGFLEPSLTHGIDNGRRLFPDEYRTVERLARNATRDVERFLAAEGIACDYEPVGTLECAVADHQCAALDELATAYQDGGWPVEILDTARIRAYLHSPRPVAAVRAPTRGGLLNPYKMVRGLAAAAVRRGATLVEHHRIVDLHRDRSGVRAHGANGCRLRCQQVIMAVDGGVRHLLRRTRLASIPLEDYVMVSEPLGQARRTSLGWERREGIADRSGAFTSLRLTADDRLFWGGSEAVYRFGSTHPTNLQPHRWERLPTDAAAWFPQLAGLRWTHRWTGTVHMSASAIPTFGTAMTGRVHYVAGYTGLGVLASKVAAEVLAARTLGTTTEAGTLRWATRRARPFPPEPLRWAAVQWARHDIAKADRTGTPTLLMTLLDRLGMGFTS